jgi:hypothetical protein
MTPAEAGTSYVGLVGDPKDIAALAPLLRNDEGEVVQGNDLLLMEPAMVSLW